jgi:acyl-CoA dehydrogenase
VPSHIDTDWAVANDVNVTHLKDKLGTKGLPTGEIELKGTLAYEIAPPGQGLKAMMTALGCSRVHNAMAAAGVMHRALMESICWAAHRETFGAKLVDRPMIQQDILDIQTEWLAGSALAFEAAHAFDLAHKDTANDPAKAGWSRVATALAKFRTAEGAVWCAGRALEIVGGNGYTEDYPVARQYRDAKVLAVWEGPRHIQALELMRMLGAENGGPLFLDRVNAIAQALPKSMQVQRFNLLYLGKTVKKALDDLAANPAQAPQVAEKYLQGMSDTLAYALMCEEAAWELANCNDAEKQHFADRFYDRAALRHLQMKPDASPLQAAFGKWLSGMGFPAP